MPMFHLVGGFEPSRSHVFWLSGWVGGLRSVGGGLDGCRGVYDWSVYVSINLVFTAIADDGVLTLRPDRRLHLHKTKLIRFFFYFFLPACYFRTGLWSVFLNAVLDHCPSWGLFILACFGQRILIHRLFLHLSGRRLHPKWHVDILSKQGPRTGARQFVLPGWWGWNRSHRNHWANQKSSLTLIALFSSDFRYW